MALNSSPIIEVDVHGLNVCEAESLIDRKLATAGSGVYRIKIIHGYNRGTAIRDMIYQVFRNYDEVKKIIGGNNQGETYLVLKEY